MRNTYEVLGIPDEVKVILIVLSLIMVLTFFVAGADFGILKVPQLPASQQKNVRVIAPILLAISVLLFLPVWPAASTASGTDSRSSRRDSTSIVGSTQSDEHKRVVSSDSPTSVSGNRSLPVKRLGFENLRAASVSQAVPQWGWAAAVRTILRYKGEYIEERDILDTADTLLSERALSGLEVEGDEGRILKIRLERTTLMPLSKLVREIDADRPFIIEIGGRAYIFLEMAFREPKSGSMLLDSITVINPMNPFPSEQTFTPSMLSDADLILVRVDTVSR